MEGRAGVRFVEYSFGDDLSKGAAFKVSILPTTMVYVDGKREKVLIGPWKREKMMGLLNELM